MMSNRYATVVVFAIISTAVLLVTSKRLGNWPWDSGYYHATAHFDTQAVASDSSRNTTLGRPNEAPDKSPTTSNGEQGHDPMCHSFPDTTGIQLVMKTGATEAFGKVPAQLMTVLRCLPEFLIFSDLDQDLLGHHIYDSLDSVSAEVKKDNPDFDLYNRQKTCVVDQDTCNKIEDNAAGAGWNLDKYKNSHIAEKAYAMRPGKDWYVFVDADTYVLWPNLVEWLRKVQDPTEKRYLGSIAMINNFPFGHGGSGYVLSGAAMTAFAGNNPGIATKYDMRVKEQCCGDYVFAMALKENAGVGIESMWPTINGEKPHTLPFGPSHWCHPIVTMHHMNSEEISTFWEFEQRRYMIASTKGSKPRPLVIKEIYHEFLEQKLKYRRVDWDNDSNDWYYIDRHASNHKWEDWRLDRAVEEKEKSDTEKSAHMSFQHCKAACESHSECFQFNFQDDCCGMKRSFLLGKPVKRAKPSKKRSMSGWDVAKIEKWVKDQGECDEVKWPGV